MKLQQKSSKRSKVIDVIIGDFSEDLKKQLKAKVPDDPVGTMS